MAAQHNIDFLSYGSGEQKGKVGLPGLKSGSQQSYAPSGGSRGESVSLPFQAFRGCSHSMPRLAGHTESPTLPRDIDAPPFFALYGPFAYKAHPFK